jgi:hypothetical protein
MRSILRKSLLALAVPTALAAVLLMFVAPSRVEADPPLRCCLHGSVTCEPVTHRQMVDLCDSGCYHCYNANSGRVLCD